ncbi:MAG: hypothetical protein WAM60_12675 [Candidatus Promineifilaceae bacterium]
MNRKKSIIAAATFTGLLMLTVLALGFGNLQADAGGTADTPNTAEVAPPATDNTDMAQALQEWQNYSAELEQTVQTLQERDLAYQRQLDAANATILQLEAQVNNSGNSGSSFFGEESHEHEQHEHETQTFQGFDD